MIVPPDTGWKTCSLYGDHVLVHRDIEQAARRACYRITVARGPGVTDDVAVVRRAQIGTELCAWLNGGDRPEWADSFVKPGFKAEHLVSPEGFLIRTWGPVNKAVTGDGETYLKQCYDSASVAEREYLIEKLYEASKSPVPDA